jgi:hypothetical protein
MRWNNEHSGKNKITDEARLFGPPLEQWIGFAHRYIQTGEWIIGGNNPYQH